MIRCRLNRMISPASVLTAVVICLTGLPPAEAQCPIQLHEVTEETGIDFRHYDGSSGRRYLIEAVSAGLALFDYDGDGDEDIYFLNGAPMQGATVKTTPTNVLYRNDGGWKFTDVTAKAGVGDTGFGLGVAAADYDNDGDLDLYVNNYGPNVMYRNNGDGTFTDVTKETGTANGDQVGAGVCFLDMDQDGDLDLLAANYIEFSYDTHVFRSSQGIPKYSGPRDYPPTPDNLFRNNGDGTFTEVSREAGLAESAGTGMGTIACDYDNDGDTDLYIANDVMPNFLHQNNGAGKFEDVALVAGVGYDLHGDAQGSMGVDCGDYDGDGLIDFHVTSYQRELASLYKNLGDGFFEDVTLLTGAGQGTLPHVTWGSGLVDFDNDGDRDLFIACGHIQDRIESYDDTASYHARNVLLMNTGDGRFVNVSDQCGNGLAVKLSSRGTAFDDLDNDGDLDVVILNIRQKPTILRNDSKTGNHWIQVRLRGNRTNRDGVGAHVKVVAGDLTQVDEVHSGRGYQSHYGMRLHFGLGKRKKVDRIEVRWIGGETDTFRDVPVDRLITITEGAKSPRIGPARK